MKNVLSVDLESWAENREQDAGFMAESVDKLLKLFDRYGFKTTFFVVGNIYDWYPEAVEKIAAAGHEIGWHAHTHKIIRSREQLAEELQSSKTFLERFSPKSFRAPAMKLPRSCLTLLSEADFKIDSSTYAPWSLAQNVDGIFEAPVSSFPWWGGVAPLTFPRKMTLELLSREIPFGSSYFMGILGKRISPFVKKLNDEGKPAILFVHPWQLYDCPTPPPLEPNIFSTLLMLPYRRKIPSVVEFLLDSFEFTTLSDAVAKYQNNSKN